MHFLKRIYHNKPLLDAIILTIIASTVLVWAIRLDAYEMLHEYVEAHEKWDVDEYLMALIFAGLSGFIYAIRRVFEAREEIKKRNAAERDVDWIASHDMLTRLPNRRFLTAFCERIDNESNAERKRFVVCAVDLDGFKKVNDLIGHAGGDELLLAVANRLQDAIPGELVVRLGGDEFVAIAAHKYNEDAGRLAQRLLKAISHPLKINGIHTEVGACIGFAHFPRDADSLGEAMKRADIAMYAAKNSGRNQVVAFEAHMKDALTQRAEIEAALRDAIRAEEIVPYYQPQVDLDSGTLKGFEALARWTKHDINPVPPTVFIGMAEDLGLITELSESLLRRACLDAKTWPSHMTLSFNISPTQLTDKLLGLRILKILGEISFPPHRLEIEITENALIRETETAIRILSDLSDAGVKIAIDDFGTGYSSLSQLSKFQFDRIKIDRSFVSSFETDARQRKIVKAIVTLGDGLGISTTAEGIEEKEQMELLKTFGCKDGQGYLFGKAVSAEDAATLLNQLEYVVTSPLRANAKG